jgi:uncharacterized protein (TIGR03437 family)
MRGLLILALALPLAAQPPADSQAPNYTSGSIVNAASNYPGPIAPNAILSLYGTQLSWNTRALAASDLVADQLPLRLPGAGVTVMLNKEYAALYYVSPTQINLLIPANATPGLDYTIQVVRDGVAGPRVKLPMVAAAPGLFLIQADTIAATHADGSIITRDSPARPEEIVVLYASGLGQTIPAVADGEIPMEARTIVERASLQVLVNGIPVPDPSIYYAGVTPGYAGLYQVNVRLPADCGEDPEIRLSAAGYTSPEGSRLPVR